MYANCLLTKFKRPFIRNKFENYFIKKYIAPVTKQHFSKVLIK
jgi:hypothetical protein